MLNVGILRLGDTLWENGHKEIIIWSLDSANTEGHAKCMGWNYPRILPKIKMDSTKIKLESNSQITVLSRVYIEMPQDTAGMGLTGKAKVKLGEKWITV